MKMVSCAGCDQPIKERYLDKVMDKTWHTYCVQCSDCKKELTGKCFARDGKLFCKNDFFRIFRPKCVKCGDTIEQNDLVLRAKDYIYHRDCFKCDSCKKILNQGDLFGLRNNLVFCLHHFKDASKGLANCSGKVAVKNEPNGSDHSECRISLTPNSAARGDGGVASAIMGGGSASSNDPSDYYLTSENAVHPVVDQCSPVSDPIPGLPAYGPPPIPYGSPVGGSGASFMLNLSSSLNQCLGASLSQVTTNILSMLPNSDAITTSEGGNSVGGSVTGSGTRKGRPRKRKTQLNGTDNHATGLACSMDSLAESLHDSSGLSNGSGGGGGHLGSCHGSSMNGSSSNKSKRVRTSFKHQQLKTMKAYFAVNQNPDAKDLKGLATKTGLTKRVLQVWFQNARAKYRKINLKMQDCSSGKTSSQSPMIQCSSNGSIKPETPSTGIGSPGGSSTRPFSTPSPSSAINNHESSSVIISPSNGSSMDQFPSLTLASPAASNSLAIKQSPTSDSPTQHLPPHPHAHHPSHSLNLSAHSSPHHPLTGHQQTHLSLHPPIPSSSVHHPASLHPHPSHHSLPHRDGSMYTGPGEAIMPQFTDFSVMY